MEGKYVLKVDANGAESTYTVTGKGPDHIKVVGTAMQAVLRTFWCIVEQAREEVVSPDDFLALSAMFTAEVAANLAKERAGTTDAKDFVDGLLKEADGEGSL